MSDPKIKARLIEENKDINWEPSHVRDGRFGEWLREIKDWAISRERYWGTPLPIWTAEDGEKIVVDSFETLKKYTKKSGNKYFVMRHGEGEHNVNNITTSDVSAPFHLTEKGKKDVILSSEDLKRQKITKIIASPFIRTTETAKIVAGVLGIRENEIIFDSNIGEFNYGTLSGRTRGEYFAWRESVNALFDTKTPSGESVKDAKKRIAKFLYEIESKYTNENILIVSHGIFHESMPSIVGGWDEEKTWNSWREGAMQPGNWRQYYFVPIPHNENYELDPHKPFIDEIVLEKDGKTFNRVKEVMDVWFDSGAMPFAQDGYPFLTDKMYYPADFIAEGLDQTRGWFYTLHAVGALMGIGKAYKNVICLGLILDKDGKKMSKSKGNVVDPWMIMDKYGADTIRLWMYSVNQPGDSKNFDEKTVHELHNKVFNLLYNVLSFYELYRDVSLESDAENLKPKNILDQWILARLNQLTESVTKNLDNYKLLEPVRAMRDFIDDLSTWYLRRSRDRLRDGGGRASEDTARHDSAESAKQTLYVVLKTLSKLFAPFAPFTAEDLWQKLKTENSLQSVHLENWPTSKKVNKEILEKMEVVREIVSLGLLERQKAKIPVRQPLSKITITDGNLENEYLELIKDELNVKEVLFGNEFILDTEITPELKREGDHRELVREIQDMRKEKGLIPSDKIVLTLPENHKETIVGFESEVKKTVGATEIKFGDNLDLEKI